MVVPDNIRAVNRRNLRTLRHSLAAEISGAVGDLGTFLPITLALARHGLVDLPATLVASGVFNLVTGVVFGVPLPVQPMKAIAAASLANTQHIPRDSTVLAGLITGIALLFLSATGLLRSLAAHTPITVIKGIQLGTGLSLILSATPLFYSSPSSYRDNLLSLLITLLTLPALLLTLRNPRFPAALLLVAIGILISLPTHTPSLGIWRPQLHLPFSLSWPLSSYTPALGMALAQTPLTALNSILAVASLSADLLPEVAPPSTTALGFSIAGMNLVAPWVRAMPVCHGAGGLAAQYRFGARSGGSVILLGVVKVVVGIVFGESLRTLLDAFPGVILGVLLVVAGAELARVGVVFRGGDFEAGGQEEALTVVMMTAAGMLALKNAAAGFAVGMLWYGAYRVADWVERRRGTGGVGATMEGERRALLGE